MDPKDVPPPPLLCDHCKQINFDALRGPSAIDVEDLVAGKIAGERFASKGYDKVHLGTLGRVREDASRCQLCFIFHDIIQRQGATYQHRSVCETLDSSDIYFKADHDVCYYARIEASDIRTNGSFILRRLSLTAHKVASPDNAIAYFDSVIQVCDNGTFKALAEAFTDEARDTASDILFGGRIRPPKIDLQLIHKWMRICADEHAERCSLDSALVDSKHMDVFRVIDVRDQSILEVHNIHLAELDFIALSYVWGTTPTVRLLKSSRLDLQELGSLSKIELPRTIADSMSLVKLLGYRYLWVDALCIVQDDPNDQAYQIARMATVYSSALLTVIAASGENSSAGLPGIGSLARLREQKAIMVIPPSETDSGLSVMTTLKSHPRHWDQWFTRNKEDADSSKWSQRAWTMQEKALSSRALVFTDEQVFWRCQQAYFCEESYFEVPGTRVEHYYPTVHQLSVQELSNADSDPWTLYEKLVNNYTHRQLTYEGDILAAFQAIMVVMGRSTATEFLWGLSWDTFHSVNRRKAPSTLPLTTSEKQLRILGVRASDLWSDIEIEEQEVHPEHIKQHLPNLTEQFLSLSPDQLLLFFWAHSAFFSVNYTDNKDGATISSLHERYKQFRPTVIDERGENVGSVCKTGIDGCKGVLQEFVAVGLRQISGIPEELADEICPPVVLALQVEKDEDGVCERVNVAEIALKAWKHAKPKRGLIALR